MAWSFEKVLLVRHGQTEWNRTGRRQGQLDSALTEAGRATMTAVAERLRAEPVDGLFSSPLGRATESAAIISERTDRPVEVLDELAEVHHGGLAGLTNGQIEQRHAGLLAERKNQLYTWRFPGGESYEDADLRAGVALDKIAASGAAHPVVVTHEMIGRMLLRHLLGLAPEEALRLSMVQGSIYVVDPANPSIAAI